MRRTSSTLNNGIGEQAGSIFFATREMSMNHVNLIGKIDCPPRFYEHSNGRRTAHFTLATKETYLDENGETKSKKQCHRIAAWGNWVHVIEEFGAENLQIALEGKLVSRFFFRDGIKQYISEVEVNDLIIMT